MNTPPLTIAGSLLDQLGCSCCPPRIWIRTSIDSSVIARRTCTASHGQLVFVDSGQQYRQQTADAPAAPIDCSAVPGIRRSTCTYAFLSTAAADCSHFCGPSEPPSYDLPMSLADVPDPTPATGECTFDASSQAGAIFASHAAAGGPTATTLSRSITHITEIVGRFSLATAPENANFYRVTWAVADQSATFGPATWSFLTIEGEITEDDWQAGVVTFSAPDLMPGRPPSEPATRTIYYATTPTVFSSLGFGGAPGVNDPGHPRVDFAVQ